MLKLRVKAGRRLRLFMGGGVAHVLVGSERLRVGAPLPPGLRVTRRPDFPDGAGALREQAQQDLLRLEMGPHVAWVAHQGRRAGGGVDVAVEAPPAVTVLREGLGRRDCA